MALLVDRWLVAGLASPQLAPLPWAVFLSTSLRRWLGAGCRLAYTFQRFNLGLRREGNELLGSGELA